MDCLPSLSPSEGPRVARFTHVWWLWNVWEDGVARALPSREVNEEVGSVTIDSSSSPPPPRVYDDGVEKGAGHWKGFGIERKCVFRFAFQGERSGSMF